MMIKRILLVITIISFATISFSQESDFGTWLGVSAKYEPTKKFDIDLSGCLRTYNSSSKVEQSFVEGGLQYNFNKHLSVGGSYRLISKIEDNSSYYFRHKLMFDVKTSFSSGNFSFSARARLQRTTKTYIEDDEDLISKYYSRLKLKAEYSIPSFPLKPYVYFEPFVPVFNGEKLEMAKNRFGFGSELKINKHNALELEYIFQRDFLPHISNQHIISLNYKIKF